MSKDNSPLTLIRRSVRDSAQHLRALVSSNSKPRDPRRFTYESLEDRRVLTATGFEPAIDPAPPIAAYVSTEAPVVESIDSISQKSDIQQTDEVLYLIVAVNGEHFELTAENNQLQLNPGDKLEVIKIGFHNGSKEGVFAAEGYVNKIGDLNSASMIDYNDGRFSTRSSNQSATGSAGTIAGLNDAWAVDQGWDRLTINLIQYTETDTTVAGRFFVNLQVGLPDLAFDTAVLDEVMKQEISVGQEVSIHGRWLNEQGGTIHNYAKVDIYHISNPDQIIWAGAVAGGANRDQGVDGRFVNTNESDAFAHEWTPELEGEYILKYAVDPESLVSESDESNNTYEIHLKVAGSQNEPPVLEIDPIVKGIEDTVIELDIKTDAEKVLIIDVPANAQLSAGEQVAKGEFEVSTKQLPGLTIQPGAQSDVDFSLTVIPMTEDGTWQAIDPTIKFEIAPVVDGGSLKIPDFDVRVGKTSAVPMEKVFADLDGSETHRIIISGLPNFMTLSAGERVGSKWHLTSSDLDKLKIKSAETDDLSGWTKDRGTFVYRDFDVKFQIESHEADSPEVKIFDGEFKVHAWQKSKK